MKINWRIPVLAGTAVVIAAALAASQGAALGGNPWWYADVFWPNFLVFNSFISSRRAGRGGQPVPASGAGR